MKKNKKILVVDDHAGLLHLLALELKLEGYDVITAPNGREALAIMNNGSPPDLVLLDVVMPVMNGLEMLSSLRELTKVPVIVHSFDEQYKEQALELGADDFILKPFAPDKLLDKIHRLIS